MRTVEHLVKRLSNVRNAIEHRDDDLEPHRVRPVPDAAYLAPYEIHAYVGTDWIAYAELARLVRTLFELACSIVPTESGDPA